MNHFYLICHAHAEWSPDEQRPLTAMGQADSGRVADLLANFSINQIYSSPYLRARQTVEPLACRLGLPFLIEPDLRERELGEIPAGQDFFVAVRQTWQVPDFAHPGGESNAAAQRRGVAVLLQLLERHAGERVVLSTHGNLLALMLRHFDPRIDFTFWNSLTMPDIYELRVENGHERIERSGKTRITIRIDNEILDWFRKEGDAMGGGNYQTLINEALREYVRERKEPIEEILRRVVREELRNYKA